MEHRVLAVYVDAFAVDVEDMSRYESTHLSRFGLRLKARFVEDEKRGDPRGLS